MWREVRVIAWTCDRCQREELVEESDYPPSGWLIVIGADYCGTCRPPLS